ncbi:MAG: hypothetical protein FWG34_08100 [Oscillospiraceae bacterium]|jgi:hypothetical protein|nr:hypothetical protein [Oscillospiraceae bacterium]
MKNFRRIFDFEKHNEEANKVWEFYHGGNPVRIPMILGMNPRMIILDEKYSGGVTFETYYNNPQIMLETQLKFQRFQSCEVVYDHVMGIPENGWHLYPDFQNDVECGWFGAEVKYSDNAVPFTIPFLREDDEKDMLLKKGIPELFGGLLGKALGYYNYFAEKKNAGFAYEGKPINSVEFPGLGTDGPMTVACMLRGTTEFCIDLYEDMAYALELLDYITEAAIFRIKGLRKYFGRPEKTASLGFADDSIQLLSCEDYERFVLPFHKRLINELTDRTGRNSIHLCGDATRHFKKIQDELNVYSFDTGFPIDFKATLESLSPETQISGGIHVNTLLGGTPDEIKKAVKSICSDVKPLSKKFIIRDANNLSPKTPLENIAAMYEAVKEFGRFE